MEENLWTSIVIKGWSYLQEHLSNEKIRGWPHKVYYFLFFSKCHNLRKMSVSVAASGIEMHCFLMSNGITPILVTTLLPTWRGSWVVSTYHRSIEIVWDASCRVFKDHDVEEGEEEHQETKREFSLSHKKNRIQVSNTKKPLFFYVNLAKRYMQQHNEVELSALGMAIATVVTIAEILKNNGLAVEKKIMTSTVDMKDESRGRPIQKAKIEIVLGKTENFDELMAAAAEEREVAPEAEEQS